jgi:hypothetical protein
MKFCDVASDFCQALLAPVPPLSQVDNPEKEKEEEGGGGGGAGGAEALGVMAPAVMWIRKVESCEQGPLSSTSVCSGFDTAQSSV